MPTSARHPPAAEVLGIDGCLTLHAGALSVAVDPDRFIVTLARAGETLLRPPREGHFRRRHRLARFGRLFVRSFHGMGVREPWPFGDEAGGLRQSDAGWARIEPPSYRTETAATVRVLIKHSGGLTGWQGWRVVSTMRQQPWVIPDSPRSSEVRARRKQLDATPSPAGTTGDATVA